MTLRLFMLLAYWALELGFVTAALSTSDTQKRQTRMLFAIWFSLLGIGKILGAIAIHTGAYPLWNNK